MEEGILFCYSYLYKMFFYWGVITFRLHNMDEGGPKSTSKSVAVALISRILCICGFLAGVVTKLSSDEMSLAMFAHLTPVVKVIFAWECFSCTVTYTEYCITMDLRRRRHIALLRSMQRLDYDISVQFPNVKWHYHKLRRKYAYGSVLLTILYLTVSLIFIFNTAHCKCGFVSSLLLAITYSILTATLGVVGFMYIALIDYLRLRYRLIIKLLNQLSMQNVQMSLAEQHLRLHKLFGFTKRCSRILFEMNAVFGFVSAAGFFYDFTIMTCYVYVVCQKMLETVHSAKEYVFITMLLIIHAYKVIITCSYGHMLHREKRNCHNLLSKFEKHLSHQPRVRYQIQQFQHWSLHNNITASIGAGRRCNTFLIYLVFNGIANYVIILVQLLFQQNQLRINLKDVVTFGK